MNCANISTTDDSRNANNAQRCVDLSAPIGCDFLEHDGFLEYEAKREPITPKHFGRLCALWLDDGSVVASMPFPSIQPGRYDLRSAHGSDLVEGVSVAYAALVTAILPGRQKFTTDSKCVDNFAGLLPLGVLTTR